MITVSTQHFLILFSNLTLFKQNKIQLLAKSNNAVFGTKKTFQFITRETTTQDKSQQPITVNVNHYTNTRKQ